MFLLKLKPNKPVVKLIPLLAVLAMVVFALALFGGMKAAQAAIDPHLNFTGKIMRASGDEIADGIYDMRFRLFTVPTGGIAVWSEVLDASTMFNAAISAVSANASTTTYAYTGAVATSTLVVGQYLTDTSNNQAALIVDFNTASNTITVNGTSTWSIGDSITNRPRVEGGVINEILGSVSDLSVVDFDHPLYLEVSFNGEIMRPRKLLNAVPYAFNAAYLQGHPITDFADLTGNSQVTGAWDFLNVVDIIASSAETALTVTQNGSGNLVQMSLGSTTAFTILANGNVGIGTGSPVYPLDIYGNTRVQGTLTIGAYTLPAVDGTSGYVLKTNGAGVVSWQPDSLGVGGGQGAWATSSDSLLIHPVNVSWKVVIGGSATTAPGYMLEVIGDILSQDITAQTINANSLNLSNPLPVSSGGTGSTTPSGILVGDGAGNIVSVPNNSANWNLAYSWGNHAVQNYFDLDNAPLAVTYGGTGTSTWTQYAIPYAAASNTLAEVPIGSPGYLLMVNSAGTGYTWVASSSAGVDTWRTDEEIEDVTGAMIATTSLITVTYNDNGAGHGKVTYIVNPDLSLYDNSTAQFFSTTTDILGIAYGGTGTTTWPANSLVYASADNTLGEILPGPNGYALVMSGGVPTWSSTTPGSAHPLLGSQHTDTATSTPSRGDLIVYTVGNLWDRLAIGPSGYVLYSNGSDPTWYNYGTLFAAELAATTTDALAEGAVNRYYSSALFAADLSATTTDALAEGLTNLYWTQGRFDTAFSGKTTDDLSEGASNLYWTNARFDTRLAATTSLPNLTTLENLTTVGTITSGSWQGDVVAVAYGGTGTTTWPANSLVYASSDNILDHIDPGPNGYALVMQGGVPTWSSSTPGTAHGILSVQHSDVTPTSTLVRGDLIVADATNRWSRLALGPAGYIFYSDGTDASWSTTTVITALGTVTQGAWQAAPIEVAYGGTGATTATGARENLGLGDIYKFAVNSTGTVGWLWQSDGDGRGHWVATSSLGIDTSGTKARFIGTTTAVFNGAFATSSLRGYQAANAICAAEYANSFFCRTYDIIVTIQKQNDLSGWSGTAWIAEGPPGYTSNSNDCNGWTSSSSVMMGAFWEFDSDGGGMGWLTNCAQQKPLACCREEQ